MRRAFVGLVLIGLAGCSGTPTASPSADPTTAPPATTASASDLPSQVSPTPAPSSARPSARSTNTLPPPKPATEPAAKTAGPLSAASLPRPKGWRTVAREGGAEEGYEGNGTWVHAKDPRYAARDLVSIGCAPVSRDDYTDPTAALEGSYVRAGAPGIGLVLEFEDPYAAQSFMILYADQVAACTDPSGPVVAKRVDTSLGLVDRRTYPDGKWTEVARVRGKRATFVILNDDHRTTPAQADAILRQATG